VNGQAEQHGVVVACPHPSGDGRWLLVRRAATLRRAPGRVGFPGGQVEPGESLEQAAAREMMEELDLIVEIGDEFWTDSVCVSGFTLHGVRGRIIGGQLKPNPSEIAEVLWLTTDEAITHPQAFEGNRGFVEALLAP